MVLRVNEYFTSIQGEGPLAGHRSVFIRLYGCNLNCEWCDTKYALTGGCFVQITEEALTAMVYRTGLRYAVITGGEPMLQRSQVMELCAMLDQSSVHTTIETNGTITFDPRIADLVVVSPKTFGSTDFWTGRGVTFKFVCYPDNIEAVAKWVLEHPDEKIYLMPEGITHEGTYENTRLILKYMNELNLKCSLSPRLQITYRMR